MASDIFNIYRIVEAVWLVIPIYAANGLVPLIRGKRPLDFGRNFFDKRRILGPGKTIEGFVAGCLIGAIIAMVEMVAFPYLPWSWSAIPLEMVPMSLGLGLLLGFGAMLGDSAGSFIKRRLNMKRGQAAPLLDQLDFLTGALAVSLLLINLRWEWVVILVVLTPIVHLFSNIIGYFLKVKKEPW